LNSIRRWCACTASSSDGESSSPGCNGCLRIGELIKVDGGVGCDLGTSVGEPTGDGTILIRGDGGKVNHVDVVSRHELDSHVFPIGGGVGIPTPGDKTSRACIESVSRSWSSGVNVCAHEQRGGKGEKCKKSVYSEHFLKGMIYIF